jgi:hypothetical protein
MHVGLLGGVRKLVGGLAGAMVGGLVQLPRLIQAMKDPSMRQHKTDGDHVLDSLGIGDASVHRAVLTMVKMLAGNLLLSWLGLLFSRPN